MRSLSWATVSSYLPSRLSCLANPKTFSYVMFEFNGPSQRVIVIRVANIDRGAAQMHRQRSMALSVCAHRRDLSKQNNSGRTVVQATTSKASTSTIGTTSSTKRVLETY